MRPSTRRLLTWLSGFVWVSWLGSCTLAFNLDSLQQECSPNEKRCGDACVPDNDPMTGCNENFCSPCVIQGGKPKCDTDNRCALDECYFPWRSCDDNPYNGCETNTALSVDHCGDCRANACEGVELANVRAYACIGDPSVSGTDRCGIAECVGGWGDCDHDPKTGCETDLRDNPVHCGACDQPCGNNRGCVDGGCDADPAQSSAADAG